MKLTTARAAEHPGHRIERSDRWDSYFCADCRVWLEDTCTDPSCQFCAGRPEVTPDQSKVGGSDAG